MYVFFICSLLYPTLLNNVVCLPSLGQVALVNALRKLFCIITLVESRYACIHQRTEVMPTFDGGNANIIIIFI